MDFTTQLHARKANSKQVQKITFVRVHTFKRIIHPKIIIIQLPTFGQPRVAPNLRTHGLHLCSFFPPNSFCSGDYELCEDSSMYLIVFHRKKESQYSLLQVNDDRIFLG